MRTAGSALSAGGLGSRATPRSRRAHPAPLPRPHLPRGRAAVACSAAAEPAPRGPWRPALSRPVSLPQAVPAGRAAVAAAAEAAAPEEGAAAGGEALACTTPCEFLRQVREILVVSQFRSLRISKTGTETSIP